MNIQTTTWEAIKATIQRYKEFGVNLSSPQDVHFVPEICLNTLLKAIDIVSGFPPIRSSVGVGRGVQSVGVVIQLDNCELAIDSDLEANLSLTVRFKDNQFRGVPVELETLMDRIESIQNWYKTRPC